MAPRVSVILPARNAESTVEAAVRSVLEQTYQDFELLALDDGSTDGTRAVLEALAREDRRVRVLDAQGRGLVHALNLGLEHAQGELIARMDADDLSHPWRFERSVEALQARPQLAGVGTQVEIFRDDTAVSPNMKAYEGWLNSMTSPERLYAERLVESPLCHPSVMLRRRVLESVGGYREGDFPEDWDLWLRLLARGERLCCVGEVLFRWRDHPQRATRTDPRYALGRHLWLKAEHLAQTFAGTSLTLWGAGEIGLKLSRLLRERSVGIERFIELHPRKIGTRIEGVPVVSPQELGAPRSHLLAAVGAKGARAEIREHLLAHGWREGEHFTCVA